MVAFQSPLCMAYTPQQLALRLAEMDRDAA